MPEQRSGNLPATSGEHITHEDNRAGSQATATEQDDLTVFSVVVTPINWHARQAAAAADRERRSGRSACSRSGIVASFDRATAADGTCSLHNRPDGRAFKPTSRSVGKRSRRFRAFDLFRISPAVKLSLPAEGRRLPRCVGDTFEMASSVDIGPVDDSKCAEREHASTRSPRQIGHIVAVAVITT